MRRVPASHLRKQVAQVGVVLFVSSYLAPLLPFLWGSAYPFLLTVLSGPVLLVAALIPSSKEETWGSMWPLVGYDNAIDAIYVRGPWWQRFEELNEVEAQERTTAAMREWF